MAKLLGIDVGTSAMKAVLVDEKGTVLRWASAEYALDTPRAGWAEQSPSDWAMALFDVLDEIGEPKPDAIGLTGQMHGMVALDASDRVVRPAILWCDQRTEKECLQIDESLGAERVREVTGNPPLTGFQLPKILWMRNNEPEEFAATKRVLLPKDYVRLLVSGDSATDVSDASGVGALDLRTRGWWRDGLEELGLPHLSFPQVFESSHVTGLTQRADRGRFDGNASVERTVLEPGIPIVAGAGDQAAGAVGTGAVEPGVVSVSLGTSGVVFCTLDAPNVAKNPTVHTFCHANGGWHAMGVMLSCGGAVKWARDTLYGGSDYIAFNQEVESVAPGCDGLTFLPYLTGERCPHNDPSARGAFAGLSLLHGRGHMARAVMEGAAFGIADCFHALGVGAKELRVTGGGAKSPVWLQMLADVLGVPCVRVVSDEGPAHGAALLAGVGVGIWPDVPSASKAAVRFGQRYQPGSADYSEAYSRYRSLYPQLKDWTRG